MGAGILITRGVRMGIRSDFLVGQGRVRCGVTRELRLVSLLVREI